MSIWSVVAGIFKPITDIIESFNLSSTEREKYRAAIVEMQSNLAAKMIELEQKELEAKSKIIMAESTGQSWLQRNWRPITMLTFLGLVILDSFGLMPFRLAHEAWTLLQIGLGGYVAGRSVEKVMPAVAQALRKPEKRE